MLVMGLDLKCFVDLKWVMLLLGLDLKCFVDVKWVMLLMGLDLKCLVDVEGVMLLMGLDMIFHLLLLSQEMVRHLLVNIFKEFHGIWFVKFFGILENLHNLFPSCFLPSLFLWLSPPIARDQVVPESANRVILFVPKCNLVH